MIQCDEFFRGVQEVGKLGFPINNPKFIPTEYLDRGEFVLFRTCHSYGDWVILSAMPRLIKQKYPDCTIVVPSPTCLAKMYNPESWQHKHENPFNNVIEIFANNPHVDGIIDDIPAGLPIYHDHFRLYDDTNPNIPLAQQMLKFWGFADNEIVDCEPELYWTLEEKLWGDQIVNRFFGDKDFGFLYIDDTFFYHINLPEIDIQSRRDLIQKKINDYNLPWLYFAGNDNFNYITNASVVDVREAKTTLRVQNYIKSKAKVIIGHQGGYGTDCMSRYSECFVVPLTPNSLNEHIQLKTKYLQ